MTEDNRSLKDLAQEVLFCQDACNLSGVTISFQRALSRLRALGINDTNALNTHPISVMFSSKIASLTGSELDGEFGKAYDICKDIANDPHRF